MVAVGRSNPTGGNIFSKKNFWNFFCLADLLSAFLSDILIVKNPNMKSSLLFCIAIDCGNFLACSRKKFQRQFVHFCNSSIKNTSSPIVLSFWHTFRSIIVEMSKNLSVQLKSQTINFRNLISNFCETKNIIFQFFYSYYG